MNRNFKPMDRNTLNKGLHSLLRQKNEQEEYLNQRNIQEEEDIMSICCRGKEQQEEALNCQFLIELYLTKREEQDEDDERKIFNSFRVPAILKFMKHNFGEKSRGLVFESLLSCLRIVKSEDMEGDLKNYLKMWNEIDTSNKDEYYNLEIRTIEELFDECFKINTKNTMKYKIKNSIKFNVLSPFSLTIDDLRKYSNDYVFGSLKEIENAISLCVVKFTANNKIEYIVKTGSYIRHSVNVNKKSYNITDYMYSFQQASYKDFEDFDLQYFTEEKTKKKTQEEEKEKKIIVNSCKFVSTMRKINLDKYKTFYRDPKEYFQDKTTKNSLNVFTGFKAKRNKSKKDEYFLKYIQKSLKHLQNLCNYNEERKTGINEYKYVVNWLGRVFRGEKTRTLLLFWSPKGGNGKSFIVVDELKNSNDDQLQQLKNIITAGDSMITFKGKDSKQENNYVNIMMNTNDVVKIITFETGDSNRRFYIIKTNDDMREDVQYFKELEEEMKQPEWASCFYNYMINQVDEDFQLDKPSHFKTEGAKQVKQNTSLILDFLEEIRDGNIAVKHLHSQNEPKLRDVFAFEDKEIICKLDTADIKQGVKSSHLWEVFDIMYKQKYQKMGFQQKLKNEAYVLKTLNDKEYPNDKILLCYEKESKYIFNPNYKA